MGEMVEFAPDICILSRKQLQRMLKWQVLECRGLTNMDISIDPADVEKSHDMAGHAGHHGANDVYLLRGEIYVIQILQFAPDSGCHH